GDRSKSFDLLVHAMKQKNRAAIGQLLMRDHEYLALIRPGMEGLILQLMFYEDEIRKNEESAPIGTKFSGKEVELAGSLIDNLTQKFDAGKFKSAYQERLEELIEAKTKGRKVTVYSDEKKPRVVDLMQALQKSVQQTAQKARPQTKSKKKTA